MSSAKSKAFNFGNKRSVSISTAKTDQAALSDVKTKRSQFSMLSSFTFRNAFSGNSNVLMKQSSNPSPDTSDTLMDDVTESYKTKLLLRQNSSNCYDESMSEVEISEENLIEKEGGNAYLSSSDFDEFKFNTGSLSPGSPSDEPQQHVSFEQDRVLEGIEQLTVEEPDVFDDLNNTNNNKTSCRQNNNSLTLSVRLLDEASEIKKVGVRRHHSAPQSEAKWLQVFFFLFIRSQSLAVFKWQQIKIFKLNFC